MGLFKTLCAIGSAVYEGLKEGAKVVVTTIASGVKKALRGFNDPQPPVFTGGGNGGLISDPPSPQKKPDDEEEKKARLREHMRVLARYQEQVAKAALRLEASIQNAYDTAYRDILTTLRQCNIDVFDIKLHMDKTKASFANTMRDEVNTKVSLEYSEWKMLMEDVNVGAKQIQAYTDRVYKEAKNHLLDKLAGALKETNDYISKCINTFLDDKNKALQIKKESLVNITRDKDSKMKELQKIMEEYASMAFIQHEAEKEI